MKTLKLLFILILTPVYLLSQEAQKDTTNFVIAFGSCNKQNVENVLWKEIKKNNPNLWIWGGDNIYADTDNMKKMEKMYQQQLQQQDYANLIKNTEVLATWDDHDYGINDGGVEFHKKDEAQQLFLDFLNVPKDSPKRIQQGVYTSKNFKTNSGEIKVIVLDTRYFRTALTKSKIKGKRYEPNPNVEGTILGETQWKWLTNELNNSTTDFNIIVSSIQILSSEHGFEKWANFPHEVEKLNNLIKSSKAKGVILLSGDRHLSEFSKTKLEGVNYPIIDFTSSGLTHAYTKYKYEPNQYRFKDVVSTISFGTLKINTKAKTVLFQMRGTDNKILQQFLQKYP